MRLKIEFKNISDSESSYTAGSSNMPNGISDPTEEPEKAKCFQVCTIKNDGAS